VTPAGPCPRCGFTQPGPVECPRCGVVFDKLNRAPRPAPEETADPRNEPTHRFNRLDAVLVLALAGAVTLIWFRSTDSPPVEPSAPSRPGAPPAADGPTGPAPRAPSRRPEPRRGASASPVPRVGPDEASPEASVAFPPPRLPWPQRPGPILPEADQAVFTRLDRLVRSGAVVDRTSAREGEDLYRRHPRVAAVADLLEGLLLGAARQAQSEGQTRDAVDHLTRATELFPESLRAWPALIQIHLAARDWRAAEQVARRGLSDRPEDALLHRTLATALMRQDRNDEAARVLRRLLDHQADPEAERLLARLTRELESGRDMAQLGSLHFRVRFEGEADDALGAALLRVLEEKHAMLTRILDYEPRTEIPVVLYPQQTFRSVSNSPQWAGATYSHFDGRIRIGTRDLSAGFVPLDLERTLTHEVVHAFVDWRTRGQAPGDMNEGLAQYLSGKRLGYRLAASRTVVRDGRMTVRDYYDSALSFVEYLLDRYGQSTMNDLLKRMGELGSVDRAFRRAYGQGYSEMREEWIGQLE
jgi:hypothetical protein